MKGEAGGILGRGDSMNYIEYAISKKLMEMFKQNQLGKYVNEDILVPHISDVRFQRIYNTIKSIS